MRFLLTLLLFIFSTIPCMAEISLESDIKSIVVEPKPQPVDDGPFVNTQEVAVDKTDFIPVERQPAMTGSQDKIEETVVEEQKPPSRISLQLSNSLLTGNVYFGGKPTHAEFNSYDLDLYVLKKNWLYGFQFDYIFNPASIKIYNLGINAGYKKDLGRFQFLLYGGIGLANYQEKSNLQNISAYGPSVSASAAVNFFVTQNLYLNVNYKYLHPMYTNDLSYWGSNPRGDVVFDLKGLGLGLGWSF